MSSSSSKPVVIVLFDYESPSFAMLVVNDLLEVKPNII